MNSSVNPKDSQINCAVPGSARPLLSTGLPATRRGEYVDAHTTTRPGSKFTRSGSEHQEDPTPAEGLQFFRPGGGAPRKDPPGPDSSSTVARLRAGTSSAQPLSMSCSDRRSANQMQHSKRTRGPSAAVLETPEVMIPQRPYSEEAPCKKPDAPYFSHASGFSRAPDGTGRSSSHPAPVSSNAGNSLAVTHNISHQQYLNGGSDSSWLDSATTQPHLGAPSSKQGDSSSVEPQKEAGHGNFSRRVCSKPRGIAKGAQFNAVNTAALILHHLLIRKSAGVLEHTPRSDAVAAITDFLKKNGAAVGADPKQQPQRAALRQDPGTVSAKSAVPCGAVSAEKAMGVLLGQLPEIFSQGLLEQLRLTLDQFVTRITPSSSERDAKRRLFNAFADFLRRAMQDRIAISVSGSTAYEVDAKGSDLDVVLLTNWGAPLYVLQSIVQYLQMTQALTQNTAMAASNWPLRNVQLQLVDSARVPVLTLTTRSGLVCDVSVNTLNSVKHTEFFKKVIGMNVHLRPMMRLLKYWAKVRKLPTMREGGLPGIVWMLLAVYFGSCSSDIFLGALGNSCCVADGDLPAPPSRRDIDVIFSLHSSVHKTAPLFAALFQFFKLCDSRLTMARTISCTGRYCAKKDPGEIAERVASAQNFFGVWDEVVSVEDPAVTAEPVFPSSANWIDMPNFQGHFTDPPPTVKNPGGFEPGISTDLAAKISSATWIVYMVELKRGSSILMKLLHFINDAYKKVGNLTEAIKAATKSSPGLLPKKIAPCTTISNHLLCEEISPGANGYEQSARDYMAKQFREYIAFLFDESVSDRFLLPGCDEKLRHLVDFGSTTTNSKNANTTTLNGKTKTTTSSESSSLSTTASSATASSTNSADCQEKKSERSSSGILTAHEATRPFCSCCSVPRNEFAIVLLHGRLHILRMTSICTDWTSWWTKDFLSRRDVRSVVHGTLHQITRPQEYLRFLPQHDESKYVLSELPPTGWFPNVPSSQKNDFGSASSSDDAEKVPYPCLLLPVRKFSDSTPVEILFHPCDFVCRLKGWRIPTYSDHDAVLVDDVFYLESDEANYLGEMTKVAAEASWYSKGNPRSGVTNGRSNEKTAFQPAASDCAGCGMDGDLMDNLETVAGYRCPEGAFQFAWVTQPSNHKSIPLGTLEMIRAAWRRWAAHASATASKHVCEDNSAPDLASSIPRGQLVITPELARATQLLAATIEELWKRPSLNNPLQRRSARVLIRPIRATVASSRRCRSLPDRGGTGKESLSRNSKRTMPASCLRVVLEETLCHGVETRVAQRSDLLRTSGPSDDGEADNESDEVPKPPVDSCKSGRTESEAGIPLNGSGHFTICRQKEIVELRSLQRKLWSDDLSVEDQCSAHPAVFPDSTPTGQAEVLNGGEGLTPTEASERLMAGSERLGAGSSSVERIRRQQATVNSQRNMEGSRRLLQSALKGTLKSESPASGGQRKNCANRSEIASTSSSSTVLGGGTSTIDAETACSSQFRNCAVEERQACPGVPPPPPSFPPHSPL